MQSGKQWTKAFREGLELLDRLSFPKQCGNCGKTYQTLDDFIAQTNPVGYPSGLSEMDFGKGAAVVGLYRNCMCRSTLVTSLKDRRDASENAVQARKQFDLLLGLLEERGMDRDQGRQELLKIMDGGESEPLRNLGIQVEVVPMDEEPPPAQPLS